MNNNSWQQQQQRLCEIDNHASLKYDDVQAAGAPARPLDFPAPTVHRAVHIEVPARDHRSGSIHHLKLLVRSNSTHGEKLPDTAYLVTKKLAKSCYGTVRLCIVLKRIENQTNIKFRNTNRQTEERQDGEDDVTETSTVEWESTDYLAAIKFSEWKKIHHLRGKHLEDPVKECAALQLLGNYHPHVLGALEVLQDDDYLYTVLPYLGGGDLYGRLLEHTGYRTVDGSVGLSGFDEGMARTWFRQLLLAVDHLQKKGVCHRDISLENLLLDKDDKLCLVDMGLALRVPYTDKYAAGVTDVSAGTCRRLMIAQGTGGKLVYAAPEVISQEAYVDAFATDLWSVGVVLFMMLVGLAPFKWAHPSDKRFATISQGGLKKLIEALDIVISVEACDLLQGFFWADPRKRLSLGEVTRHPWVLGNELVLRPRTLPVSPSKIFVSNSQDVNKGKKKPQSHGKKHGSSRNDQVSPELHHRHITQALRPHI